MPNFFSLYREYVKSTEPPPNFHAWASIGAISALLGKKVVIPQGKFDVHPQLYIILVGEPGTRKSTAMNIAKKLVKSVEGVFLASDSGSREGLMDEMAKNKIAITLNGVQNDYWQSAIFVDEIADLLGGEHIDSSMVRFLTTIWDQRIYKEATRKGGQVVIHNPYLTLLGCCPTKWMNTKLQQDVITDGLSRRTIFALETELNHLNPWPENTVDEFKLLAQLEGEAKRIHEMSGKFELSSKARKVYDAAYLETNKKARNFPEKVQAYFSSKHILVLKVAMCLSAGVSSDRKITQAMIETAIAFLGQSERNLVEVFSGVGRNELKAYADRVLYKIRSAGEVGLNKADIIKGFYDDLNAVEINEVFDMLQNTNQIRPTRLINVQDAPHFAAAEAAPLPPAVDLMPLASRLGIYVAETEGGISPSGQPHRLDPETLRSLVRLEQKKLDLGSGVLMRGTRSRESGE